MSSMETKSRQVSEEIAMQVARGFRQFAKIKASRTSKETSTHYLLPL